VRAAAKGLRLCAGSATPASRSLRKSASRPPPSVASSNLGLNRLSALEPAEPIRRYERAAPGEIVHIDIKKLGKFNRIGHRITGERSIELDDPGILAFSGILSGHPLAVYPDFSRGVLAVGGFDDDWLVAWL
jgi:hypothetical protein